VEINALVRLNPSDPYWEVDWLCGARYVYLSENFALTGVDSLAGTETYDSKTTNNLIGAQTGLLFVHGWYRVRWEAGLKAGVMANFYHQNSSDTSDAAGFIPLQIANSSTGLSAAFEASVAACYRITDNLGLRLGYQFYDFTGLALGPRQLSTLGHGGNVALDGVSVGLQATW
jgi:hypothetical protein